MDTEYKLIRKFQSNGIDMVIVTIGSAACVMDEISYNRIIKTENWNRLHLKCKANIA